MPFKVVQTLEGKKIKLFTVPSGWESDNVLRYPNKAPSKYIKDPNSTPTPDWDVIKCKVKRNNVLSYEAGEMQVSEMMKHSDTDDDTYLFPRRPQNNQKSLNLNSMLEKMVDNVSTDCYAPVMPSSSLPNDINYEVAYFEEPNTNTTITSQVLSDNIYQLSGENINNTTEPVQDSVSLDINKIFENQKQILDNQATVINQMLEHKQQQLDNTTTITRQIQGLINVQNNLILKVSGLSVQLDDAVSQIAGLPNQDEVTTLNKSKFLIDNIPIHIKPIDSVRSLDELEKQLSDKNNRDRLKNTYSILCSGGKAIDCAYLLIDIMFARSFICQCSWSGGSRGENLKIPLKGYKHVLSFFWEMVHSWDGKYTLKDNEIFFKTILKNSQKRKLAKLERASTSRVRSKRMKSCQEEGMNTSLETPAVNQEKHQHITLEEKNNSTKNVSKETINNKDTLEEEESLC